MGVASADFDLKAQVRHTAPHRWPSQFLTAGLRKLAEEAVDLLPDLLAAGEAAPVRAEDAHEAEALVNGSTIIARAGETVDEQGFDIGLKLIEHRVARDDGIPVLEVERRLHGAAGAGILGDDASGSSCC